jgi:hypothetical protein
MASCAFIRFFLQRDWPESSCKRFPEDAAYVCIPVVGLPMCCPLHSHLSSDTSCRQLWRMEFDDEDLGVEDLEEHEVLEALSKYQALAAALSTTGPAGLPLGWKRIAADEQGQHQVRILPCMTLCEE